MIMVVVLDLLRGVHSSERWDTCDFGEAGAEKPVPICFLISVIVGCFSGSGRLFNATCCDRKH